MEELLITTSIDKEPYIKSITNDNVINITGESGSGKSYYTNQFIDKDYIVIDTDEVFGRFDVSTSCNREFGEYLRNKYEVLPRSSEDFNTVYKEILEFFKDRNKTIVIDSAQFRNIKKEELNILKGKIIILRTCIDTCYRRCIDRWKQTHSNCSIEELDNYKNRKLAMYEWYKSLNDFIINIDKYINNKNCV